MVEIGESPLVAGDLLGASRNVGFKLVAVDGTGASADGAEVCEVASGVVVVSTGAVECARLAVSGIGQAAVLSGWIWRRGVIEVAAQNVAFPDQLAEAGRGNVADFVGRRGAYRLDG